MPPDPLNANDPIDYDYVFTQAAEGKGGLDDPANAPAGLSRYYEYTTIDGKQYQFPWKAVATNQSDQVSIKSTKGDFPTTIGFQLTPEGGESKPLSAQASSTPDKKTLSLLGGYHQQLATLSAYVIQQDTANDTKTEIDIAAVKIISYSVLQKKVTIIPVNELSADQSSIETALNNIYAQAITEWEVTVQSYTADATTIQALNEGESGAFTQFTPGMKSFNKAYKNAHPTDNDTYYIFLVNGTAGLDGYTDKQGYMPFNRQYGYIFMDNLTDDLGTVIAHELGHGAFNLEHPESEFGTTLMKDNLMRASTAGTALKKYQWDNIHDPLNNSGWLKEDEESGLGNQTDLKAYAIKKAKEISDKTGELVYGLMYCKKCDTKQEFKIIEGGKDITIFKDNQKCFAVFYTAQKEDAILSTINNAKFTFETISIEEPETLLGIVSTKSEHILCTEFLSDNLADWDYCATDIAEPQIDALFKSLENCLVDAGLFNFSIDATVISELQGLLNIKLPEDVNIQLDITDAYGNEETIRKEGTEGTPPSIKVYITKEGLTAEFTKEYLAQLGNNDPSILDRLNNILNDILNKAELNLQDCDKAPIECAKNKLNLLQVINLNLTSLAKNGVFDKSMWDETGPIYKIIPKEYGRWHPVVGGGADGVVEEVTDLPMLLITAGEVLIDKQQQQAIAQIFTKEGIKKLGEVMAHNIVVIMTDENKIEHAVTKGSVQALFLWYALANAAGKGLKELLENAGDLANKLDKAPLLQKRVNDLIAIKDKGKIKQLNKLLDEVDPKKLERLIGKVEANKVDLLLDDIAGNKALRKALLDNEGLVKAWDALISHPLIRKDIASLTSVSKILDNTSIASVISKTELQTVVQNLAQKGVRCRTCTSGNPAYKYLDEILDDLEHGAVKFGDDYKSVVTGFKQGGNFTEGAMFVADAVKRYGNDFPTGTVFEFVEVTAGGVRRVDVRVGNVFYEFKSVASVPPSGFATQFAKDLSLNDVTGLDQLKWWFDGNKVSSLPKQQFLDALDNMNLDQIHIDKFFPGQSNVPLSDLVDLIDGSFSTIFSVK